MNLQSDKYQIFFARLQKKTYTPIWKTCKNGYFRCKTWIHENPPPKKGHFGRWFL